MRLCKYFFALWIAVAIYAVSYIIAGPAGTLAYEQLSWERDMQAARLESLTQKNTELQNAINALKYDSETIAIYARELGYGRPDERFIRIVGFSDKTTRPINAGEVYVSAGPKTVSHQTLVIISICAGLCAMLCIGLADILRYARTV
jgi:cell division protein FtsB